MSTVLSNLSDEKLLDYANRVLREWLGGQTPGTWCSATMAVVEEEIAARLTKRWRQEISDNQPTRSK